MVLIVAILSLVWTVAAAAGAVGPVLQPIRPWILDYAEAQCVAMRDYGPTGDVTSLAFRPAADGETTEILMIRPGKGPRFGEQHEGAVDLGNGLVKTWELTFGGKQSGNTMYEFRIPNSVLASARSASTIELSVRGGPHERFSLAQLPQLLDGLKDCVANLRAYWNVDGEKTGLIATPSRGDLRPLFSSQDYPDEAFSRSQEGTAQFLLLIDEKGKVAGCQVVQNSGSPALDVMGCQVIRERARFSPARGANGAPVRSSLVTPPITWRME